MAADETGGNAPNMLPPCHHDDDDDDDDDGDADDDDDDDGGNDDDDKKSSSLQFRLGDGSPYLLFRLRPGRSNARTSLGEIGSPL